LTLGAPAAALALLGAHFYRAGAWPLLALCVGLAALLAVRRTWAVRTLQGALWLGALEWAWTAFELVQQRIALGQPWLRLALILGAAALLTAAAARLVAARQTQ
jgi:hypothetical protein